ncbi:hypothetical protein J6590_082158 [Homalodisca vitripennis]|nr:hypothetical protein J6590_082158 [Homalodisca vitripennis]
MSVHKDQCAVSSIRASFDGMIIDVEGITLSACWIPEVEELAFSTSSIVDDVVTRYCCSPEFEGLESFAC